MARRPGCWASRRAADAGRGPGKAPAPAFRSRLGPPLSSRRARGLAGSRARSKWRRPIGGAWIVLATEGAEGARFGRLAWPCAARESCAPTRGSRRWAPTSLTPSSCPPHTWPPCEPDPETERWASRFDQSVVSGVGNVYKSGGDTSPEQGSIPGARCPNWTTPSSSSCWRHCGS